MIIQSITIFITTICFYPVPVARYITDVPAKPSSIHIQEGIHNWTHTPWENFPSHIWQREEPLFKAQQSYFSAGLGQTGDTEPKAASSQCLPFPSETNPCLQTP